MVKHIQKARKLMEMCYRMHDKITFFKFTSRNVCVDFRHSENTHFREKVCIQSCNMTYKVSCQSKRKRTT